MPLRLGGNYPGYGPSTRTLRLRPYSFMTGSIYSLPALHEASATICPSSGGLSLCCPSFSTPSMTEAFFSNHSTDPYAALGISFGKRIDDDHILVNACKAPGRYEFGSIVHTTPGKPRPKTETDHDGGQYPPASASLLAYTDCRTDCRDCR